MSGPAPGTGRTLPQPRHRKSFPLYVVAGIVATASHYLVTVGLVELLAVRALVATSVGFACGAVVKYFLNYFLAFESEERHSVAVPRFAAMLGMLFLCNAAIFWLLNDPAGLHYMVAQVITTVLLVPLGYVINRLWVFR